MKMLTSHEIEKLAGRKGIRRIAVENFLMSLCPDGSPGAAYLNLDLDAKLYRWNAETKKAITAGIRLAYSH